MGNKENTKLKLIGDKIERTGSKVSIFTWISILVSIVALIISIYMAHLQYVYSDAEYMYKRDPKIGTPKGTLYLQESVDGDRFFMMKDINIEITEENNLEKVYLISPDYGVTILPGENYTEEMKMYFNETFRYEAPDLKLNGYMYFYRFVLFEGLDDDLELNLFYLKTETLSGEGPVEFVFNKVDRINLLHMQKGNRGDSTYEGERKMAKQYEELCVYYQILK